MYQNFVYLIISQNRLIITQTEMSSKDYYQLLNNNGYDQQELLNICKTYCLGFIGGATVGKKPVNSPYEFQ